MKFDVKKKIMLAVLAGGMLCANGAWAENFWYGKGNNATTWWSYDNQICDAPYTCATGANLSLDGTVTSYNGINIADVDHIYAGYSKDGNVTGNKLKITGGSYNDLEIVGGASENGNLENNTMEISGGTFTDVSIVAGYSDNGSVNGNTIKITGGKYTGDLFQVLFGNTDTGNDMKGNTIEISGNPVFEADVVGFYGGDCENECSNNKLNLKIKLDAFQIASFDTYNFTLPADIEDGDIMLKTNILAVTFGSGGTATINVDFAEGVKLKAGNRITLIDAGEGGCVYDSYKAGTVTDDAGKILFLDGAGNEIDPTNLSLDDEAFQVILEMLKDFVASGSEDKEKAPVEGIAAGVAMINQSADLAMGEGMASLLANTDQPKVQKVDLNNLNQNQNENTDTKTNTETDTDNKNKQEVENNEKYAPFVNTDTFGAITASRSKYQTGSHVDMDGWGVLVGVGQTQGHKHGDKTTYGLFFEYGKGDFDTYNNDIHGEGDSNNKGVGIMARHTLNNNTYFDANIRYGKQETEWSESEIGGYDTDSRYYGAAVGLGHIYPLENNDELDIYVRYSYGHVGACDAKVKDSDYHFDKVLSQRLRFGAKYNFVQQDNKAKPYIGMAWERELKGESRATITGVGEAPAPSLKGNTGIFEIGCDWETGKWALGAGANAYIGKRKGWSGTARAFYNF